MKHTPAPLKSREQFFSSTQGCTFLKKSGSCKKAINSSTKFIVISSEMSKKIKFNYFECCFKWYFHNFGLIVRLFYFANTFVHAIVSFQYTYDKCLGCNM